MIATMNQSDSSFRPGLYLATPEEGHRLIRLDCQSDDSEDHIKRDSTDSDL